MTQQNGEKGQGPEASDDQRQGRQDGWTRANDDKDRWQTSHASRGAPANGQVAGGVPAAPSFVPSGDAVQGPEEEAKQGEFGGQDYSGRDYLHGNAQSAGDEDGVRAFGGGERSGPQGTGREDTSPAGHYDGANGPRDTQTDEVVRTADDSLLDDDSLVDLNAITAKFPTPIRS